MVVDRYRQMVAGRRVFTRDHEVAHQQRLALDPAQRLVEEGICTRLLRRVGAIEAHAVFHARRDAAAALVVREVPAGAGIEWPVGAHRGRVRRTGGGGDISAGAEAGIDQAARVELVHHPTVIREVVRLAPHLAVPGETKPLQVRPHRGFVLAAAAPNVDILDPHQEGAARVARAQPGDAGRIGAAEMKFARRTGGKTRDHGHTVPSRKSSNTPGMCAVWYGGGSAARRSR